MVWPSEERPLFREAAVAVSARTPASVVPARTNEGRAPVPQPAAGTTGATTDAAPVPQRAIRPVYPIGARRRGESGAVTLDAAIGADGRVRAVRVQTSSGFAELDHAAQRAVEQARFTPAQRQGAPVDARIALTILFRLTE
jgi:protein TonB